MNRTLILSIAASVLTATALVIAGPLNPPAGSVASTYKTLTEVEPRTIINAANTPGDSDSLFKITQPGSYYLAGNVTGVSAKSGIKIAANGVSIDLMGFELLGVAGSLDGITVGSGIFNNISIHNGSVRNWGHEGVDLQAIFAVTGRVTDVRATSNSGGGILVGNNFAVSGCTASLSGAAGIGLGTNCSAINCTSRGNSTDGFTMLAGCTLSACSAMSNTGNGFTANTACNLINCISQQNTANGITSGQADTITACTLSANSGNGLSAANSCTISACTVSGNTLNGIIAPSICSISNCTVRDNLLDGIRCQSSCTIAFNLCTGSGFAASDGANIHVTGNDNRIEGNNCVSADRGIDVDISGNIIIRNTCTTNTVNWDIAGGNICLVVSASLGAAFTGNAGGTAPGSTDPNVNFTY